MSSLLFQIFPRIEYCIHLYPNTLQNEHQVSSATFDEIYIQKRWEEVRQKRLAEGREFRKVRQSVIRRLRMSIRETQFAYSRKRWQECIRMKTTMQREPTKERMVRTEELMVRLLTMRRLTTARRMTHCQKQSGLTRLFLLVQVRCLQTVCWIISFKVHTISLNLLNQRTWVSRGGILSTWKLIPFEFALAIRQNFLYPFYKLSADSRYTYSRTLGRRYSRVWQLDFVSQNRLVVSFLLTIIFPSPKQHSSLNLKICQRSSSSCLVCSLSSIPSTNCEKFSASPCLSTFFCVLKIFLVVSVSCMGSFFCSLDLIFSSSLCNFSNFLIQVSGVIFGSMSSRRSISSWVMNISLFSLSAAISASAILSHKLQAFPLPFPPWQWCCFSKW